MSSGNDESTQIRVWLDDLAAELTPDRAERIKEIGDAGNVIGAVRAFVGHLVNQQVPISGAQRESVARLLNSMRSHFEIGSSRQFDPEWVLPRLFVDGVRSPEGADVLDRRARVVDLTEALQALTDRYADRLETRTADDLWRHVAVGQQGMAVTDLIGGLIERRVLLSPEERDEVARVRDLAESLNGPELVLDAKFVDQLNVAEGEST